MCGGKTLQCLNQNDFAKQNAASSSFASKQGTNLTGFFSKPVRFAAKENVWWQNLAVFD